MSTMEWAVLVIGAVGLLRKARPFDGWAVVVAALGVAGVMVAAREAIVGVPTGPLFQLLTRALGLAGVAFGLVHLADRVAHGGGGGVHAATLSSLPPGLGPVAGAAPTDSEPPPLIHRGVVAAAVVVLLFWCSVCSEGARLEPPAPAAAFPAGPPLPVPPP